MKRKIYLIENVTKIMRDLKLNKKQMGELMCVSREAVYHYITGRNFIPTQRLISLSEATGYSIDELIFTDIDTNKLVSDGNLPTEKI